MSELELVPDPVPRLIWPAALPRPAAQSRAGITRFTTRFDRGFRHGPWSIGEIARRATSELSRLAGGASRTGEAEASGAEAAPLDWEGALFLDLESGPHRRGGACVHLAGIGRFDPDGFEVRQVAAIDPEAEVELLAAVAAEAAQASSLVTFAGRSFDAPLLVERARAEGVPLALPRRHFDLYRMGGRILRRRFDDSRLVTLERELLRFERGDDLPSGLVPVAWRSGIEEGDDSLLWAIVRHNLLDVLALPALAAELALRLESPQEELEQRQLDGRDAAAVAASLAEARRALKSAPPYRLASARRRVARLERRLESLDPEAFA